jgi:hypothetical protein
MLAERDLATLITILKDTKKSLEKVTGNFQRSFAKVDFFKIGSIICILIEDKLLTRAERIVGFVILVDLYRSSFNPFLRFFLDALEKGDDICERQFLVKLLLQPSSRCVHACVRASERASARACMRAAGERSNEAAPRNHLLCSTTHQSMLRHKAQLNSRRLCCCFWCRCGGHGVLLPLPSRESTKKSAHSIITEFDTNPTATIVPDLKPLWKMYKEQTPPVPATRAAGVRPVVINPQGACGVCSMVACLRSAAG